jgi:undecaprenyl-diphosphatase
MFDFLSYSEVPSSRRANQIRSASAARVLLATTFALLVLFGLVAENVVHAQLPQPDVLVRARVHQWTAPALTTSMRYLSTLGSTPFLFGLLFVVSLGLLLSHRLRTATLLVGTMTGAALIELALRYSFHRVRPTPFFGPSISTYSFPSGHALGSVCFYGVVAVLLAARARGHLQRLLVCGTAALLILLIGLSRIYLGMHYLTDVLAGYLAGACWASAIGWGFCVLNHRELPSCRSPRLAEDSELNMN